MLEGERLIKSKAQEGGGRGTAHQSHRAARGPLLPWLSPARLSLTAAWVLTWGRAGGWEEPAPTDALHKGGDGPRFLSAGAVSPGPKVPRCRHHFGLITSIIGI